MFSKLSRYGIQQVIAAGALAMLGLGLAGWALWPHLAPNDPGPRVVEEVPSEAQQELTDALLDTPVGDQPEPAIEAAVSRLTPLMDDARDVPARDDLVAAFRERLRATIDGEYERDTRAKIARGMEAPPEPNPEGGGKFWQASSARLRGSDIGIGRMEVRWILRGGDRVAPSAADEGYGITKTTTSQFESAIEAIGPRPDVVEVRLPMDIEPVKVFKRVEGEAPKPVLVGYQFAWSPEHGQWIPYANCMYTGSEGVAYGSLPF